MRRLAEAGIEPPGIFPIAWYQADRSSPTSNSIAHPNRPPHRRYFPQPPPSLSP